MRMSKHQGLQKILVGEIVFDKDFHKIKKIHKDVKMMMISIMVEYI